MYALPFLEETTTSPDVAWLLWVALGFFALMVLVGWLASRNRTPEPPAGKQEKRVSQKHH
jgi:hypothetical protein